MVRFVVSWCRAGRRFAECTRRSAFAGQRRQQGSMTEETWLHRRIAMLVAYLTVDEVNQDVAVGLAERCNLTVHPLALRDWPQDGHFDAVVYDLDSFPAPERDQVLAKLLSSLTLYPVAVHSYN